jgi:ATP-dependent Clp protease adaptor protein ClpS
MVREKLKPRQADSEETAEGKRLMLHNDEVNSFEFVIECLVDVCHHEPEQAEQCALIAHFKGKCPVKSGDLRVLKPYHKEMLGRGLTVTID